MACSSLITLVKNCGSEGLIAGVQKLYMVSANDLISVSGSTGASYSVDTNGIVNAIGLGAEKKFVEIGIIKNTTGLNEEFTINENGTNYSTETLTLKLADITVENKKFVDSVRGQEVAVIVKSRTGKFYTVGLNGLMKLSALSGGLGLAEGDDIGYNLTFSGVSQSGIQLVDVATVATSIA
ncbi:hypothetical protein [Pedobacter gandavensis]|uniref:hypothetical protein n=1 Tax=Pedobacter gandavensis TaxID=2679963 RepID=UPI0029309ABE|nr:hypothetical protein [Pedobacter gandavensis]